MWRNVVQRSRDYCPGKAITIAYYELFVCSLCYPSGKAHAQGYHLWLGRLSLVSTHYLIKYTFFGGVRGGCGVGNCWIWNMCLDFSLQILSETYLIIRRTEWDIIMNVCRASCKVPLVLSNCNETWILWPDFGKNTEISNYKKICAVGAELCHADRWTDGQTDRQTDGQIRRS